MIYSQGNEKDERNGKIKKRMKLKRGEDNGGERKPKLPTKTNLLKYARRTKRKRVKGE